MNSIWLSENKQNNQYNQLAEDKTTDVCIIGAGIFGITCGYYLAKAGLKVTIIEKDEIGSKATGHTTAKITSQHGLFYTYLYETYGEKLAKEYLNANQEAIENIKQIIEEEKINCDFEIQSSFVYTTNKSEVNKIKKEVDILKSLGFPANSATKIGLPFEIEGSVQVKDQAQFNPIKYINGLAKIITKSNGQIYTNTTANDVKQDEESFYTLTERGTIKSKYVIIATHYPIINFPGIYFLKMYQSTSYVIGVDPKKTLSNGMYISATQPTYSFRTANYNGRKILLLGGESHKTGTESTYENTYGKLENYAKQLYPNCEILFRWDTRDCITLDKIPYIGKFSSTMENIYVGTGFNKWGMTTSNVAANIICDMILGKQNKYAYVFDSTRIKPIKNITEVKNMITESINSLAIKKLKDSNITFEEIPNNSGGIIDINNQKVGIYKDTTRKYICS